MIRAFSVPDVRSAEAAAMADLEPGILMQRAAAGLAEVTLARARERAVESLVVLVGPGDNGGDALYAAAHLSEHLAVVVVQVGDVVHEGGLQAVLDAGVPRLRVARTRRALTAPIHDALAGAEMVVDGLLGIGGRPGLTGAMAGLAESLPESAWVIAVDLPSGADPAGVTPLAASVRADETVTFSLAKPVHLLPATSPAVGWLTVTDIGVPEPQDAAVERLTVDDVPALWPVPGPSDDKYSRGVLGVVAGSARYPGAAVLAVSAAAESGAGMVRYVGPDAASQQVLKAVPEAVPGQGQVQAWLVGPGIPVDETTPDVRRQLDACRSALASDLPCVVDAGALDLIEGPREAPTLLTPHAGELARMLSRLEEGRVFHRNQISAAPLGHARRVAELTGAVVILKGATTLVVAPEADRSVRSQADAPPWLATAGAGDVLAGLVGALVASGLDLLDAGSLAALVHGLAAHRANPGGPVRALAVAQAIPGTVADLLRS
ncbi:bifunctional ADP-dependent NAD(P)H-hydrate dehydratase/NAD(P)H-hydrate epimerase [Ornithinimicrobium sp. F0845]|uniref:bifunctional ADP-dependent NAD(P)H-hydrate dehydratase/NAD(P)H-hydrate epimerase n=1 Tax=Ornithinimicrobium sp. F0845 TaxID=2926412 RepID=UPI001FF1DB9D|nr:bifunctional ADP-dependent NAD(P)H-hydrate dehydratase/NAD(P)H-hydrate epimerase [Ornithinimicrobium sp. F0845]MCK0112284.1 bifunctional ADP-dependent NAD(P)H-hydrate dehydratase/NAD(P)H-hydrate epimerase [Ornithinimicrobium sp. F0845]